VPVGELSRGRGGGAACAGGGISEDCTATVVAFSWVAYRINVHGLDDDPQCNSSGSRGRAGVELTFSKYNEPLKIAAPPGALNVTPQGAAR
jgi:hypothetical protein